MANAQETATVLESGFIIDEHPYAFWERQVHALLMLLAKKQLLTVDELRRSVEGLPEEAGTAMTYYQKWASAITNICLERGTISRQNLDRHLGLLPEEPDVKFNPGDYVRIRQENSAIRWRKPHLRTPGYIFGLVGVVERECIGVFTNPELKAFRETGPGQPLYRIRFFQQDLWEGYHGGQDDTVDVEVYQAWLEPASKEMLAQQQAKRHEHLGPHDDGTAHDDHHHSSDEEHEHHADEHHHGHHHHHGHGTVDHGDHVHEGRHEVEQAAIDKEGDDSERRQLSEALIATLVEAGVVAPDELRQEVEAVDSKGAAMAGPRIVARAWVDPEFRARLLEDAGTAVGELGISSSNYTPAPAGACAPSPSDPPASKKQRSGTILVALEATEQVHHLVVCTLCSCYPFAILGLSPPWYKSRSYRSRAVRDPHGVLRDFGTVLPPGTTVRVHDSTADCRYIVIPRRPAGTEGWPEEKLQQLVTRDSMIGVALAKDPKELEPVTAV